MKFVVNEDLRISIESMKQIFDEYIRVGFTEEQTIKLICAFIRKGEEY